MNFYVTNNGQQLGPYSIEQIHIFLKQGLVTTADQVWSDGWPSWMPIGSVPGMIDSPTGTLPGHVVTLPPAPQATTSQDINWLCVWMHLSQFSAFIILVAGYVMPILIWQANKNAHPLIDRQGRIITNWIITSLIYDVAVIVLCFFWIGFLIAPFLVVAEFAFPIIGAIKASKGEAWNYPMNIKFFKY